MLSIRLDNTVEQNIDKIAARLQTTRSDFLRQAIISYLEDMEDYFAALDALQETEEMQTCGQKAVYTLDEINEENAL